MKEFLLNVFCNIILYGTSIIIILITFIIIISLIVSKFIRNSPKRRENFTEYPMGLKIKPKFNHAIFNIKKYKFKGGFEEYLKTLKKSQKNSITKQIDKQIAQKNIKKKTFAPNESQMSIDHLFVIMKHEIRVYGLLKGVFSSYSRWLVCFFSYLFLFISFCFID